MISSRLSPCSWLTLHSTSSQSPNLQTTIINATVHTPTPPVPSRTATTSWCSPSTSQVTTCPSQTTRVAASGISRTRWPQVGAERMTPDIRRDSIHSYRDSRRKRMRVIRIIARATRHRTTAARKWRARRAVTGGRSFNRIRWTEHRRS